MSCEHRFGTAHYATIQTCDRCGLSDFEAARIALGRISGALCDASTVVVDPPEQGIHELTAERDAYRAMLADVIAFSKTWTSPRAAGIRTRARALLKHGPSHLAGGAQGDPK